MPSVVLPQATSRGGYHFPGSIGPVLAVNMFLGPPVYVFAFLFAYGFSDQVGWSEHLTFLAEIAVYSVPVGVFALSPAAVRHPGLAFHILTFGILISLALNAAAVGIGSVVSAANKDQGSVSANFSTITDVLVAFSLLGISAGLAYTANRVRHPR